FAVDACGERRFAYSGGLALNCVANARILAECGLSDLFVFPASNDAGVAVGAAYAAAASESWPWEPQPWIDDFRGYPYRGADYAVAIREYASWLQASLYDVRDIVGRLAAGQVIGWFD